MTWMRRRFVRTSEAKLAVAEVGSGTPVVLLASLGRSAISDYTVVASDLARAGYRSVAVDFRGVGESYGDLAGLTLDELATDVAAVIASLAVDAHVVGHAFGNRIARTVARLSPEAVRSVTLLAAGGAVPGDAEAMSALRRCFDDELADPVRQEAVATAFFAATSDPSPWADGWWPIAAAGQVRAVHAAGLSAWWDAFSVPTCVIQGLQDRIAPPANGRLLVETLSAKGLVTRLHELQGAGHALLPERPDELARLIVGFLQEVDGSEEPDSPTAKPAGGC